MKKRFIGAIFLLTAALLGSPLAEEMVTIDLRYASPELVEQKISTLFSDKQIKVLSYHNMITLRGDGQAISEATQIIRQMDQLPAQFRISVKEIENSGGAQSAGEISGYVSSDSSRVIVRGGAKRYSTNSQNVKTMMVLEGRYAVLRDGEIKPRSAFTQPHSDYYGHRSPDYLTSPSEYVISPRLLGDGQVELDIRILEQAHSDNYPVTTHQTGITTQRIIQLGVWSEITELNQSDRNLESGTVYRTKSKTDTSKGFTIKVDLVSR